MIKDRPYPQVAPGMTAFKNAGGGRGGFRRVLAVRDNGQRSLQKRQRFRVG
jgi:hypothetical protein